MVDRTDERACPGLLKYITPRHRDPWHTYPGPYKAAECKLIPAGVQKDKDKNKYVHDPEASGETH